MNLIQVRNRFSDFLKQFNHDDIAVVMDYLSLTLNEYENDPEKYIGN